MSRDLGLAYGAAMSHVSRVSTHNSGAFSLYAISRGGFRAVVATTRLTRSKRQGL